jgi:Spy/CpxP family protein refolding chaperone
MNKNRTIALIVTALVCGVFSFVGTRIAAVGSQKTADEASVSWLAKADPSVIKLEEKFNKEVDGLVENLLREQENLASVIEDPCTTDESILAQDENVIAAHERLLRRVGEHVAMLRLKLPGAQRKRLMDLCAEVLRGPIGQGGGRSYGYGGGRRMGWQDSSGQGRGQRGRGFGRGANGRGYGLRRRQRGRLAQRLNLTDEQIMITQGQDPNFESDLSGLRNTLLTERAKLVRMFEDAQTDNKQLLEQIDKMISTHSQVERRIARYLLVLRQHLNPEQQKWLIGLCKCNRDRY